MIIRPDDEINAEFHEKIDEPFTAQERKAARSTFTASSADKEFFANATGQFSADLIFSTNNHEKANALAKFEAKLETIEDEAPFSEVIKHLPEIVAKLQHDEYSKSKLNTMYHTLKSGLKTS